MSVRIFGIPENEKISGIRKGLIGLLLLYAHIHICRSQNTAN